MDFLRCMVDFLFRGRVQNAGTGNIVASSRIFEQDIQVIGKLLDHEASRISDTSDEFGLTTADYERAGLIMPKRSQQATLSWTREDGKHASLVVYDHEIQPLLDTLNEKRRQERRSCL